MTDAQRWGIEPGYHDVTGEWHDAKPETVAAVLAAMGAQGDGPPEPATILAGPGRPHPRLPPGEIVLEDGTTRPVAGDVPYDLPLGYHRYHADASHGADPVDLITTPGRCWLPDDLGVWGWAVQLYAARSRASWGMGDLADLARLGRWSAGQGASVALINPLHAAVPVGPPSPSPYFASSRCFRNPLYLRVEDLPGATGLADLASLAAAGHALNAARTIDRDEVWRLKSAALETLFQRFAGDADFDHYRAEQGPALEDYATFCALCERYGTPWGKWPVELRAPRAAGIPAFAAARDGAERIRYHAWLQWLLDRQLQAAGETVGLVQDLAIGADPAGADAWRWQDTLALDARVGAPPDEFNPNGQDWALPPFDPWKLRACGYRPFAELVRAGLRHAGGLRFDHVLGLFRLFWIPAGSEARNGAYVCYPAADLLDILALESHRAQAFVVGEDLGTVADGVREELAARQVLSYRLLWFEPNPPGGPDSERPPPTGHDSERPPPGDEPNWPRQAMAAATTHDLPTAAGLWSGADLRERRRAGLPTNDDAELAIRRKLQAWLGVDDDLPVTEFVIRVYQLLARAPCAVVTATLDDALAVEERPNMPGTVDEWPNWCLALPQPLELLEDSPLASSIAASLRRDRS